ncbi:MAG: Rrf2 family transcriptional regulator [Furfurilactobacillus sp.]|jgi:Rrf2 family protein|uniref:Rrf2 family transcriptional regulator n=2 Tax=Furfurilactobacillus TaxID=2767882 RepID=A0A6N9HZX6_9LACO|nr:MULTISPECIES: Rrf2 family transcriptional regulator [Furfurilactobacillus]QLE66027.1 Rrf2 transcriptional regulator [Furfurilactobacillus rossiae]MCF6161766.1 Rrf2 family transcriptional regulator [Furfurilactobacillus milii]MCF6164119.1 Rrf2 family transcriptional regulator [Furfurilactobacillus milii]MCF6419642.1 Rrf2 family transcriptional regulator [Furfurilactobacillus milii]MCH4012545.1 Rrf2 family transcriptional regulator [Furfurilactobacillus sp.]
MQLTRGFEQAACILALLATQDTNVPITSEVIHTRLGGSQTYMRKIIRKLVVAGLVRSVSGNQGGFTLGRNSRQITVWDAVVATEGDIQTYPNNGLIDRVFDDVEPLANRGTQVLTDIFVAADEQYKHVLQETSVHRILVHIFQSQIIPTVDWNESTVNYPNFTAKLKALIHGEN